MTTLAEQLDLEECMFRAGAEHLINSNRNAEEEGHAYDTAYARKLAKGVLPTLISVLDEALARTGPGKHSKARALIKRIDSSTAMYISVRELFNRLFTNNDVQSMSNAIGTRIEDELRFARFKELNGPYYDAIMKDFKRKGTVSYRHMRRVLAFKAGEQEDQWESWSTKECIEVGLFMLELIIRHSDIAVKKTVIAKRGGIYIEPSQETLDWVNKYEAQAVKFVPRYKPCLIEPDDWTGLRSGGYYSPAMRSITPLIMGMTKYQKKVMKAASMPGVYEAVNLVQKTPWAINTAVHDAMQSAIDNKVFIGLPSFDEMKPNKSPFENRDLETLTEAEKDAFREWKAEASSIYTKERERKEQARQFKTTLGLAAEYRRTGSFWYVWRLDFRARMYTASASLSPQGEDCAKSLLCFARKKPLGDRGMYWLKVHIANKFGYDKESYDKRVAWTTERHDQILDIANDPSNCSEHWKDADKPWQFLAACFEYRDAWAAHEICGSFDDYWSALPVGLDGTCNGLQHFAAMLRDEVSARAVNLAVADKPSDIYTDVAKECLRLLKESVECKDRDEWLQYVTMYGAGAVPRKLAKRPVMTLPYGSTQRSCTKYIAEFVMEGVNKTIALKTHFSLGVFKASSFLTPIMWGAIKNIVRSARDAMSWLRKCATEVTKAGHVLEWHTFDGFPVIQYERKINVHRITTQLCGRIDIMIGEQTDEIDRYKQASGIAPNFVHSQDGTHLRLAVRIANKKYGIEDFAVVHDDYGTHAGNIDNLHKAIRESFVLLYSNFDPLRAFVNLQATKGIKLPEPPEKGSFNIKDVLRSQYFFG